MPAKPRGVRPRSQVSLRFMFLASALIALFLGLRRSYLMTAFDLDEAVERARNIPIILAFAAAILTAMLQKEKPSTKWSPALRGVILGSAVGSLSCLALAIEFGEMLRRMDYWDWWRDWIWVAPHLFTSTVQGGAIGAFVLQVGSLVKYRRAKQKGRSHSARSAVL